jgi:PQQ-dependent dehydrogenase (methanol/ethanol family)
MNNHPVIATATFVALSCLAFAPRGAGQEAAKSKAILPVTDEMLLKPGTGDWLTWRRTHDGWGYSPLDQIHRGNIQTLQLAWAWNQEPGNQEAAPLVKDGVMYLAQSDNVVHALNAETGDMLWEYRHLIPELKGSYVRRQFHRARNSIALYGDKVYLATGDARLIALDARTGKIVWNLAVADYNKGFNYTSGPLVVKGKVIAGISGCTTPDTVGGCFISAHDAESGKELWRTHTLARPGEPGDETWAGLPAEKRLGGSSWGTGSYDPELDLTYWGTAPPIPHSELARGIPAAAHLYTNSTLALNPNTGKIVWYFQHLPGDNWNLDHTFERVLVDGVVGGKARKILLTVGKTGIVWALDRKTGEYLWSRSTIHQNVVSKIDAKGQVTLNEELKPKKLDVDYFVCPALYGGRIWQATAYDPQTKLLYVPLANMCNDYKVVEQPSTPGEDYGRGRFTVRHAPDNGGKVGRVEAVNVLTGEPQWKHERRPIVSSGLLATGGGFVIGGDAGRRVFALDAKTGSVLWELPLSATIGGFPMTYMVNGVQYLAIPVGTNMLAQFSHPLTPEVIHPNDTKAGKGSMLVVFRLPQKDVPSSRAAQGAKADTAR